MSKQHPGEKEKNLRQDETENQDGRRPAVMR
jgi:hypothetical protein